MILPHWMKDVERWLRPVEPLLQEEGFLAMPDKQRNAFGGVFWAELCAFATPDKDKGPSGKGLGPDVANEWLR